MQKIIHVTDTHIVAPGDTLYGIDPAQRLRETLAHISRNHEDASAILITGDLADAGHPAAYELLRDILSDAVLPIHLTIGNHDCRSAFHSVFGGSGFVQTVFDHDGWRFIVLDTKDDASHEGSLDGGRLEWLDAQISEAEGRPVLLAMHHTPGDLHVPRFAVSNLKEPVRFIETIRKSGAVRHMLFGHRHVAAAGALSGIPFTISRGTAQHIVVDLKQMGKPTFVAAAPSYDVVFLDNENVIVHTYDGLDALPAIRPAEPA